MQKKESAIIVFIFHWTRSVRILPASVWPERWASFLIILSSKRAVPSWGCIAVRNGKRQQMSGWKQKKLMGHDCRLYAYSEERLQDGKIALIAGGCRGNRDLLKLREAGIRLLLTGVGNQRSTGLPLLMEAARQAGVSILAAGHYSARAVCAAGNVQVFWRRR